MADGKPVKRIFINQVDSYHGYNLAKFLSNCVVGASLEEEEEEEEEAADDQFQQKPKEGCYEIHGTLKDPEAKKPDFVKEVLKYETQEEMFEHLVECDVIVYDITQDESQIQEALWLLEEINSNFEKIHRQVMFILLSTVMTWAKSKPLDPDDPEIPFTEEDYRRRKAHPNFKEHIDAEKTTIKYGKTNKAKLITYTIASGLTYGAGENIFHYLYKAAWHNSPQLLIFGGGQNVLPTIHVRDLAAVIQNVADSRPKPRYLIAVDDSQNTLEEIVRAVSANLGNGKVKNISKEEALLNKELEQSHFDHLLTSLRMDAAYVKENMRINWASETGIVENIEALVKEYKQTKGLQPIRACVLGPPAVGKTTVVKQLCAHYKLHHIKIKDVVDEAIANLEKSAARADAEEEEDDDGRAAEDAETLEAINESRGENNGRIDLSYITRFFKEKLMSTPCQNQGFILDGYPKTREQAEELFSPEDEEEEEEEGKGASFNRAIMPDDVIVLEADDHFLKQRVMQLPEAVVAGTHNTEDGLLRRLAEYRNVNNEEDTVQNYFDEREIHPLHLEVTQDSSFEHKDIVEKIKAAMGPPRNYGPTPEEIEEMRQREEEERLKREAEERAIQERQENEESNLRKKRLDEWTEKLEALKKEEHQLLEVQSQPLRNYLMNHVMPVLTQGLMDCVKARPEDAVDYLAEYLFRNNPQVD